MENAEISELYGELRKIASFHIRKSVNHPTLHPTMLVHEAWMRINGAAFKSKTHYLAVASRAMRNVVVDYIRAKTANRRGGDWQKITLEGNSADAAGALAFRLDEVLDLDAALDELAQQDERKARVVEMRFFGGMEFEEVAEILEVSVITVKRDWSFAKAWLGTRLKP
ncbi:MAG: sigma-70 family RNA polymerase sigma factor [Acidobacteria bacterium]|nr:sigma-70 family RNA polymerase sigma factor [Acidobacteriota bacterium]